MHERHMRGALALTCGAVGADGGSIGGERGEVLRAQAVLGGVGHQVFVAPVRERGAAPGPDVAVQVPI